MFIKRIFIEGLIAGILAGIAIKTGIDADEGSIMLQLFGSMCTAFQSVNSPLLNCGALYALISVLIVFASVYDLLNLVSSARDWRIGAGNYVLGFAIGFVIVFIR